MAVQENHFGSTILGPCEVLLRGDMESLFLALEKKLTFFLLGGGKTGAAGGIKAVCTYQHQQNMKEGG